MAILRADKSPNYIRCYDNGGESIDRYTVVFTGRYRHKTGGAFWYLAMNAAPFHPQGFGQHGENDRQVDRPTSSHLGKRIKFADLPEDCRTLVARDYADLWDIPLPSSEVYPWSVADTEDTYLDLKRAHTVPRSTSLREPKRS